MPINDLNDKDLNNEDLNDKETEKPKYDAPTYYAVIALINETKEQGLPEYYPRNHDNLIQCMKAFGYTIDDEGMCNGYANAAVMLKSFSKEPNRFYDYLALINIVNSDGLRVAQEEVKDAIFAAAKEETLAAFSAKLNTPITSMEMLSKEDQKEYSKLLAENVNTRVDQLESTGQALYNLSGFFDTIALSQTLDDLPELGFDVDPAEAQHEKHTYPIIETVAIEERGGLEVIRHDDIPELVLTNNEFKKLLTILDSQLKADAEIKETVTVKFGAASHESAFSFDPATKNWSRVGANVERSSPKEYTFNEMLAELYKEHGLLKHDGSPAYPFVKFDIALLSYTKDKEKMESVFDNWLGQADKTNLFNMSKEKANFTYNIKDPNLLILTIRKNDVEMISDLIATGADVNKQVQINKSFFSPSTGVATPFLTDQGMNIIRKNLSETPQVVTALDLAIVRENENILQEILKGQPNNATLLNGIKWALVFKDSKSVEMILNSHQVNFKDNNVRSLCLDTTLLHFAVAFNDPNSLNILISKGAKTGKTDNYLNTPLHLAADIGNPETVRVLLQHNANITAQNGNYMSPLQIAAEKGHVGVVNLLLAHSKEHGNKYSAENINQAMATLIKNNVDINQVDEKGISVLQYAKAAGYTVDRPKSTTSMLLQNFQANPPAKQWVSAQPEGMKKESAQTSEPTQPTPAPVNDTVNKQPEKPQSEPTPEKTAWVSYHGPGRSR